MSKKIKKLFITILAIACVLSLTACGGITAYNKPIELTDLAATFTGEATDADGNLVAPFDVVYADAFNSGACAYEQGHILLKMKKSFNGKRTNELRKCGIESLSKFMETDGGNWWKAELNGDFDAVTAVKKARSLDVVIVADFDYIYQTESVEVEGDTTGILSDVCGNQKVGNQQYLKQCSIQEAWKFLQKQGISAGGLSSVTVAVIDTGVDYTHPDLKANMWVNMAEIPNNGKDDDGNGYIDDIYGIDTIADNGGADGDEGNPMDDHGHGTHVAGIIGATNNKEGVVGVAYNAKIMAIKAGQASGVFNQSDIAEGILYAYQMGADVINMSFGGSACSIAVQDALATAYTTASLVASAGNDGKKNEKIDLNDKDFCPNYPAALSYVIGVMSVNDYGVESVFTNWDTYTYNNVEYEVYAPGEKIMSTLPNGRYGALSGTSMSAPVVSGAAALLRSYFTDRDMYPSKFIMAQICSTSEEIATCIPSHRPHNMPMIHNLPMILDIYKAFTKMPKPDVNLYDWYLFDGENIADGNSGDGVVDAGETIEIGAVLRNRWGMSKDTIVTVSDDSDLGVDNPYVEIITESVDFGGVGTYSTKDTLLREGSIVTGIETPLVIKIADNCPNDYLISLRITITCKNALDDDDKTVYETYGKISFSVRNGVILPSQITEDMTLTKDNYYIVENTVYIHENVTVNVEPGTQIQFYSDDPNDPYADLYTPAIEVWGRLIIEGTQDEMVEIFPSSRESDMACKIFTGDIGTYGYIDIRYAKITNPCLRVKNVDHCYFDKVVEGTMWCRGLNQGQVVQYSADRLVDSPKISNSIFYKIDFTKEISFNSLPDFDTCTFVDCAMKINNGSRLINCVFSGNYFRYIDGAERSFSLPEFYSDNYYLNKYVQNPDNGTVYLIVSGSMNGNNDIEYLAEMMGGDIACIETKEEWDYIAKTISMDRYSNGISVGIQQGRDSWKNGESLGDHIKYDTENAKQWQWGCLTSVKLYTTGNITATGMGITYRYMGAYVLIEIPSPEETGKTIEYDQEYYEGILEEWRKLDCALGDDYFYGNAILNNLNVDYVDTWLNIVAGSGGPKYYRNLGYNYFGTLNELLINKQIVDFDDYSSLIDIIVGPTNYIPENTFPFVTDAFILDANGERVQTVGNEKITVVVQFNRDMNTDIPLRVRFGSFYPYADYEVSGEYVSPREWRGEYTLKTTIENGNLFFNIENGEAVDDSWLKLYEHAGRFTFELDTTSAQAMIMQGEATETGINLTWMQDDFETLLGYNIYRSDAEDGLYVRLNDYVLSQEENTFFDDTVEPGKVYYYNFTVVKTDLTESIPSGKIVIMSMDTMAPNIYHSPVRTAYTNNNLLISATITDNLMIKSAKLYYRTAGSLEWKSVTMNALNSKYTAFIGAENLSLDGLEYYIEAFDGVSYTYKGSADNAYQVTVKLAIDANSLGDVDGDGAITVKDAQMLLMAINDLYNLTEEQFMRADIDGNGILQAFEALRILDYVSGKVTTILL